MIINGDCIEEMKKMQDCSVDLIVTSPPYAEQREKTYGGIPENEYVDWFLNVTEQAKRVLKDSGSFVLNIKDHVKNGVRSGYVYQLVSEMSKSMRLTDVYIWVKPNPFPIGSKKRLKDGFEYCYWFTKTKDYKFFPDNVLVKSESKWIESEKRRRNKGAHSVKNGSGMNMSRRFASDMVRPSNVITLPVDSTNHDHPATFPVGLPEFFIKAMTEPGDVVLDPFAGSGTTGVACINNMREFIGIEINPKYCRIANERIAKAI